MLESSQVQLYHYYQNSEENLHPVPYFTCRLNAESRAERKNEECEKYVSKLCAYISIRNRTGTAESKLIEAERKANQCDKTALQRFLAPTLIPIILSWQEVTSSF